MSTLKRPEPKKKAETMLQEQNKAVSAAQPEQEEKRDSPFEPAKGKKIVKVLGKKKTIKDNKGDEWEVTEKRESTFKEKAIVSDSDEGSELSMD